MIINYIVYIVLSFTIFLLVSYQYKSINKSILITPLAMAHMTLAISIVTVISLYRSANIPEYDFILLITQQIIFLFFVIITPIVIKRINYNFQYDLILKKN